MKKLKSVSGGLLVCMLLAATAFAANKGSFEVYSPFMVNGKQLKAGTYSLQWDGNGPSVQLTIQQGKKVVATTSATVVPMEPAPSSSSAVLNTNPDGSQTLTQIRFGGKKYALEIAQPSGSGASGVGGSR